MNLSCISRPCQAPIRLVQASSRLLLEIVRYISSHGKFHFGIRGGRLSHILPFKLRSIKKLTSISTESKITRILAVSLTEIGLT